MALEEHFCEIILKLGQWPRRICCLKVFYIFISDGHFVQPCGTILAILVKGQKTFLWNDFEIKPMAMEISF